MAKSDPVEVAVDILDGFTDDLEKLEKQLDRIDGRKLSVTLDIDDNIEDVKALLKSLEEKLETTLKVNVKGYKKAFALKAGLSKDTNSVHRITTKGGGGVPDTGSGGGGDGGGKSKSPISIPEADFMRRISRGTNVATDLGPDVPLGPMQAPPGEMGLEIYSKKDYLQGIQKHYRQVTPAPKSNSSLAGGLSKSLSGLSEKEVFGGLPRRLAKFRPTMHKWMNLVAALIPMMITLAGAALGVVAAFGAIAGAGAAILGIGLLGYGDSIGESMKNAGKRVKELKRNLFGVMRPVANTFNPIVESFFDEIPGEIQRLVDPLKGTAIFEGLLSDGLSGVVGWLARLITMVNDLAEPIEAIAFLVSHTFGDLLLDLFRWAVEEVYNNYGAFADLAAIFGDIIIILYNVSKAVSFVIAAFRPLFDLLAGLSNLLNNAVLRGILITVTSLYLLRGGIIGAGKAWKWFIGLDFVNWAIIIGKVIKSSIARLAAWVVAVNGAKMAWRAFLASTGLGLLLVGAGWLAEKGMNAMSDVGSTRPANSFSAGSGHGSTINIYGDVGNSEYQKLADEFPVRYAEQKTIDEETAKLS